MKCPACPTTALVMTDRSGIEIDYCPDCRGVWLDRGELDKIIERTTPTRTLQPAQPAPAQLHRSDPAPTDARPPRRDRDDDIDVTTSTTTTGGDTSPAKPPTGDHSANDARKDDFSVNSSTSNPTTPPPRRPPPAGPR